MFRIKICGVTRVDDALTAVEAGADAIGLNFCSRSPRHLAEDQALAIVQALPAGVSRVGVFVNEDPTTVRLMAQRLGLDWVQLHGDEPPGYLTEVAGLRVLRAFRCGTAGGDSIRDYLALCLNQTTRPRAILVDAATPGQFGGTGMVADWTTARELATDSTLPPVVLAGGLTAENVAGAIRAVGPVAIDTASGVESSPGVKDPGRLRSFVAAALGAWESSR